MKKFIPGTLLVAGLLTAGGFVACHSFSTLRDRTVNGVGQVSIDSRRVSGLVYYLPKGRIRITGDFKSGSGDGDAAAKPGSTAGARLRAGAPSGSSGGDSAEQKNFVVTIAADVEADPKFRYYLQPVRNYFYDDDIRLTVNAKHLLSTGNATAEDQTAKIISTTASLVAQVAGVPAPTKMATLAGEGVTVNGLLSIIQDAINKKKASEDTTLPGPALLNLEKALGDFPSEGQAHGRAFLDSLRKQDAVTLASIKQLIGFYLPDAANRPIKKEEAPEFFDQLSAALTPKYTQVRPFSIVFDPADRSDFNAIKDCGFILEVTQERPPEIKLLKEIWEGKNKDVAHGIAFRAVKPYRVTIKSVDNTWFYIRESQLVLLPDTCPDHTLVLDYSRLAFVKKTTNIGFVDGVPQNLAQTVPSSVLGFLAIPKGIIDAIVPLPPALTGPPGGVQGPGTSGTTGAPPPPLSPSPTPGGL